MIDTEGGHASIEFRTQHLGFSWLTGRFNEFSGSFSLDADNPKANAISVDINVDSIDSNHAERDKHLRSAKYLDTSTYSKATFVSTSITPNADGSYAVVGDFTMRDTTQSIAFTATQVGAGDDPWGGYRIGFEGEIEITFNDYGYNINLGPATTSAIIKLSIEGVRQ